MRILIIPIFCRSVENSIYIQYICIISSKLMKTQEIARSAPMSRPRKIPRVYFPTPLHRYRNLWKKTQVRYQNHARFPTPKTYKSEESLGNWGKFLQHFERNMALSKVWSFLFAAVLLMLVAACYSEDSEDAVQEPMPGECVVINPRVLFYDSMTTFDKIPVYQSKISDNLKNILLTNVFQINFNSFNWILTN